MKQRCKWDIYQIRDIAETASLCSWRLDCQGFTTETHQRLWEKWWTTDKAFKHQFRNGEKTEKEVTVSQPNQGTEIIKSIIDASEKHAPLHASRIQLKTWMQQSKTIINRSNKAHRNNTTVQHINYKLKNVLITESLEQWSCWQHVHHQYSCVAHMC